jgi:hypothetical protein
MTTGEQEEGLLSKKGVIAKSGSMSAADRTQKYECSRQNTEESKGGYRNGKYRKLHETRSRTAGRANPVPGASS